VRRIKVSEIMRRDIVSVLTDTSIKDAAEVMIEKNVGSLAVKRDGVVVGIVTKADFVKIVSSGKKLENIEDLMSTPPIKVPSDTSLVKAISVMQEHDVKHLFVEDSKNIAGISLTGIVGIISLRDITNRLPDTIS